MHGRYHLRLISSGAITPRESSLSPRPRLDYFEINRNKLASNYRHGMETSELLHELIFNQAELSLLAEFFFSSMENHRRD